MDFDPLLGKDSSGQSNHSVTRGFRRTLAEKVKTKTNPTSVIAIHKNITGKSRYDFTAMTTSVTGFEFTDLDNFPPKVSKPKI